MLVKILLSLIPTILLGSAAQPADGVGIPAIEQKLAAATSADFSAYSIKIVNRVFPDVPTLIAHGTHRTMYRSEARWSIMSKIMTDLQGVPTYQKMGSTGFGIILLSNTDVIGSLFCRNPYFIAASETAVECYIDGKTTLVPMTTVRRLFDLAFTAGER